MRAWLSAKDVHLEERDFFRHPFSEEELRSLIGGRSPADIFSWKSPSFQKLDVDADALTGDDLIRLMLEEPRLIRRPLTVTGDELIVGSDKRALGKCVCQRPLGPRLSWIRGVGRADPA